MQPVKVGIIGSGFSANIHMEALKQLPAVEVVAVASPTQAHLQSFAQRHNISKFFTDYRQLLELKEVQVVNLCLPNYLHAKASIDCANAGKHIICEKPLCMNLEEADAMIEAAKRNNVKLMYAENVRFAPKYVRAKKLIEEGALGKVYLIKHSEKHFGPHSPWFWDIERSGGGVLMDMGCHGIEFARWILNKPAAKSVYAQINTYVHKELTKGEDNSIMVIEFEDSSVALIESSWAKRGGMYEAAELYGSDGVVYADLSMSISLTTYSEVGYGYAIEKAPETKGWTFCIYEELWNWGYPQELAHFINCVRGEDEPQETGEDGRQVLEIIIAAYQSARLGRRIELPFYQKVAKPIDLYLVA